MKQISIRHISNGTVETGGFRHEQFLMEQLASAFEKAGRPVKKETIRYKRFLKGWQNLQLMLKGINDASADVNLVSARFALSSMLRDLFGKKRTLLVLHYFSEQDGKGLLLSWYYRILFFVLRNFYLRRTAVVAVAPYWADYFRSR